MDFQSRIKQLRIERGLTQKEFAALVGFSVSSVCKWEEGLKKPGIDTLNALADFFHESTDYLLGRTE